MGWEKLHLGLKLERAAGKGCPEPRDPTVPPPWGTRGSSFPFFWDIFLMDLWDLCCPSAPPLLLTVLVFGHDAKNGNQTHFQSFPVISSSFGEREWNGSFARLCPASLGLTLLVSPSASSVSTNPGKAGSIPVGCVQGGSGGSRGQNAAC